mgnify:CR=1 FL=1
MSILVTSAGRRVSLVKGFMEAARARDAASAEQRETRVYTADMRPELSPACLVSDGSFPLPHAQSEAYPQALLDLCRQAKIKVVVPTIDTELLTLATLREEFAAQGVELLVSDRALIETCRDKRLTAEFFVGRELNSPALYEKEQLHYPVFVKPYNGSLSAGVHLLRSEQDMTEAIRQNPKNIFCEYIDHDTHDEVTVDMYYDRNGTLKCVVPRKRIEVRGGEVAKALTEKNEIVPTLFSSMATVQGARGCLTLQLFRNRETHTHSFIEINARFGGGYPLCRLAGADFQAWIIDEYLDGKPVAEFQDWEDGLLMLRYDAEILVH